MLVSMAEAQTVAERQIARRRELLDAGEAGVRGAPGSVTGRDGSLCLTQRMRIYFDECLRKDPSPSAVE